MLELAMSLMYLEFKSLEFQLTTWSNLYFIKTDHAYNDQTPTVKSKIITICYGHKKTNMVKWTLLVHKILFCMH